MRRALVILVTVAGAVLAARALDHVTRASGVGGETRVVYVVDGDTVHVRRDGRETKVRVIGVDAPEVRHPGQPAACFGDEATAFVRRAVLGRRVRLTVGAEAVDRYGRTLATLVPEEGPLTGRDLSEALANAGFARPLAIAPNTFDAPRIADLSAAARQAERGLWGRCGFAAAFPGKRP